MTSKFHPNGVEFDIGDDDGDGSRGPYTWTMITQRSTTGLDIEVNYVDFRDASGEIVEVGDSAGVRCLTLVL